MIDPRVAGGLRDLPPSAAIPRERLLAAFRGVFAAHGYLPIETPHIERVEVLTGKGAGSAEVLRQIFDVTNKGGTPGELALRFDLTVPLARFIAKHVDELGVPFRRYAIGSVFRGERPAKGRFREFTQCDFDVVGATGPVADAETVQVVAEALAAAGIGGFRVAMNHRQILNGLLDSLGLADRSAAVLRSLDKLDKVGREAVGRELVDGGAAVEAQASAILDFAERGKGGIEVLDEARSMTGSHEGASAGIASLRSTWELLTAAGVPESQRSIDLGLARGLDYYTGIVFETTIAGWEKFGSVASGGRYDDLAGLFTSRALPGVGGSIGLDRLLALMDEAGWLAGKAAGVPILVAQFPGGEASVAVRLATRIRAAGVGVEVYPDPIPIGKQLGYGSTRGHRFAVIVGPDEAAREVFNLRDLATRQERKAIPFAELEVAVKAAVEGA